MHCPHCDHDNIPGVDLCEHCGLDLAGLDVKAWGMDPDDPILARHLDDLPLKSPVVVAEEAPVAEAIRRMRAENEGCVFVLDGDGGPAGVLTERDVSARVAARGRDPQRTPVGEVMTRHPVSLRGEDPLAWALHRMGVDGHRHIPVTRDGKLTGFLSARTVLRVLLDA